MAKSISHADVEASISMHVRCPHCHNPTEAEDETSLVDVVCMACGSSFHLTAVTASYQPGTRVLGHFELIEEVGIGRFGSVWKARDTKLQRRVAVKIPRAGQFDPQQAELFLRDARAGAQLTHSHIVSVHEVGREGDVVYIVSDYVEGANLKEWLSGQRPSIREAAQLVVHVARAVQHAHEAGVVHRDLKPGNIMIDLVGEPHVIDFGLARRTTDDVTLTAEGQVLGTPAYMSPEQARGESHQADRRTDIYSLGVILFELLTGELPFRGEARMLVVQILRDEPPSPRRLNAHLPRDLETITLKCLEKEPSRRYQTAAALADDLDRFLAGEPIRARPVGRIERSWRWCKRNRAVATAGTAALAMLFAGSSVCTYYALEAGARAREADAHRRRAETNLAEANRQRQRAEDGLAKARQAVDDSLTAISENQLLDTPGLQPLRKDLLQQSVKYYEGFARDLAADPSVRAELAATYVRVGNIRHLLGELTPAETAYRRAIDIYEGLAREDPAEQKYQGALAKSHHLLVVPQEETGRYAEAEASVRKAVEIQERLAQENPAEQHHQMALANGYDNLATLLQSLGRDADAEAMLAKARQLYETLSREDPEVRQFQVSLARSYGHAANLQRDRNLFADAERHYRKAIEISQRVAQQYPAVARYQSRLAAAYHDFAHMQGNAERAKEAEALFLKAIEIDEKLIRENPGVLYYQERCAADYGCFASQLRQAGRAAQAIALYRKAIETWEKLARENPAVPDYANSAAIRYSVLGNFQRDAGNPSEAETAYRKALQILQKLAAEQPTVTQYQFSLAETYEAFTKMQARAGRGGEARAKYQSAIEQWEAKQPESAVDEATRRHALAFLYAGLAVHLALDGVEWEPISRAVDKAGSLAPDYPIIHVMRGDAAALAGKWRVAADAYARIRAERASIDWQFTFLKSLLLLAAGDDAGYRTACRELIRRYGDDESPLVMLAIVFACGVGEDGVDDWDQVLGLARALASREPVNPAYQTAVGMTLYQAGQPDEAAKVLAAAIPLHAIATLAAPNQRDQIEFSRLVAEIGLALAYHKLGREDDSRNARKRARQVIARIEATTPNYDENFTLWSTRCASRLGKRKLELFFDDRETAKKR